MAQIRKHKESHDPITAALRAAMGDPVKPAEPGSQAVAGAGSDDAAGTPRAVVRPVVGATTFVATCFAQPKE